jgi:hypothetical protein
MRPWSKQQSGVCRGHLTRLSPYNYPYFRAVQAAFSTICFHGFHHWEQQIFHLDGLLLQIAVWRRGELRFALAIPSSLSADWPDSFILNDFSASRLPGMKTAKDDNRSVQLNS